MDKEDQDDLKPRNYQTKLMKIAIEKNSIIYLPTGSGKTFIALMVLKRLSEPLQKPVKEGGKVTLVLVSTVALVEQHSKTIQRHTAFTVGSYSGDMNVDSWSAAIWNREINNHQILVMTAQIAVNIVTSNYLNISNINLLIFDECHHAVNDDAMRQLMKLFENVTETPRVLGLTATLINCNIKPDKVINEVQKLETTFMSKIATVDALNVVESFSTNPQEVIVRYEKTNVTNLEVNLMKMLLNHIRIIKIIKEKQNQNISPFRENLRPLDKDTTYNVYSNIIKDVTVHLEVLGPYGCLIASLAHMINLEKIKRNCEDQAEIDLINVILTLFQVIRALIKKEFKCLTPKERIIQYSSSKLLEFFDILRHYQDNSQIPLSALVFCERRFTCKVLYHLFKKAKQIYSEFENYECEFMVGFNNNPNNNTRELGFLNKMNKKALSKFENREVNILFATKVLEEGIDMQMCSLVVRFDIPQNYSTYVQSKGRARHKDSFFYIMVDKSNENFMHTYKNFKAVEQILNSILIGNNDERDEPNKDDIQKMFEESILPPYFVDGPNSPQINMLNCISRLAQYCQCFSSDQFTSFEPDWYLETNDLKCRVIIELPIVCPLTDPIKGTWEDNKKNAKRTAAYFACVQLHQIGELNNFLLPVCNVVPEEDTKRFFRHWPDKQDSKKENARYQQPYTKKIPDVLQKPLSHSQQFYLHLIVLKPSLYIANNDIYSKIFNDLYENDLTYGIITTQPLVQLCQFPVYVSRGKIMVEIVTNSKVITLSEKEMFLIRCFNYIVYHDVLKILKNFLVVDTDGKNCQYLIVPVMKNELTIPFSIIEENMDMPDTNEKPTVEEITNLKVDDENYKGKIVTPWYKYGTTNYIVVEVCHNLNAMSPFPSADFASFHQYFNDKYNITILNTQASLLHVKALSNELNCLKPRARKKKDDLSLVIREELCPELCIKQNFPAVLWVQAHLIPTILHRFDQLNRAEELRSRIAKETGIGVVRLDDKKTWSPLETIPQQMIEEKVEKKKLKSSTLQLEEEIQSIVKTMKENLSKVKNDVSLKTLEHQFPWLEKDEPVDIDRNLNVTVLEIQHYQNFISKIVSQNEKVLEKSTPAFDSSLPSITFPTSSEYVHCNIEMINQKPYTTGPELKDIYQALCTAKCNEIVNFERLETLGDSFLKFSVSLFIFKRFPKYNEGKATQLKGRIVSNKNLLYAAIKKNLQSYIKISDFSPNYEWLPPGFCLPSEIEENMSKFDMEFLSDMQIPKNDAISGKLSSEIVTNIQSKLNEPSELENRSNEILYPFLNIQLVANKSLADCVEAILGAYIQSNGLSAALQLLEWFEIIPAEENITQIFSIPPSDPLLKGGSTEHLVNLHLTNLIIKKIEENLGYTFRNKGFLLQALTHSSYTPNRVTDCYQRLEFLGDAILDFLITCHIYETCGNFNPGELTDLRSALVNNITFAAVSVRLGLHKFLLHSSQLLSKYIDTFVSHQEAKNFVIDEQVLILLEEKDTGMFLSEHIDVPKVLGDVFEAMIGAIFLDSGNNLNVVWKIIHKIMWQEISSFKVNIPKNAVRMLYETQRTHPKFYEPIKLDDRDMCMIKLDFMANGEQKTVYGFGENKLLAKRAAAKFALRLLQ